MKNRFILMRTPVTETRMPGQTIALKRRYPFQSTPTTVIIRPNEAEAGRIVGANDADFFVGRLQAILNKI